MQWETVTLGHILTIVTIILGLAGQVVLFAYVFGRHKGTVETELKALSSSVTIALSQCQRCDLPHRMVKVEEVQHDRNEQMARMDEWIKSVDRRLENIESRLPK